MRPEDAIEALRNSPETVESIINSLKGDYSHLEHYWALNTKNGKAEIVYEYYGHRDHIPSKYMNKRFLSLHSHVDLSLQKSLAEEIERTNLIKDKEVFCAKDCVIRGTSAPSFQDIMSFIMGGHTVFGVCSLLNTCVKFSFYDPTTLSPNDLRTILDILIASDSELLEAADDESLKLDDYLHLTEKHLNLWNRNAALKRFMKKPHSAHMAVSVDESGLLHFMPAV